MFIICITGICLAGSSAYANQRDKKMAEKHFKAGLSLLDTDNYEAAATEFEASVELHPTKNGLFNLANCYFALRRYRDARETITKLKTVFNKKLSDDWLGEISSFEQKLKDTIVTLEVHVDVAGATINLDGATYNENPLKKMLDPGEHEVTASAKGYETSSQKVNLKPGTGKTTIFLNLKHKASVSRPKTAPRQSDNVLFLNEEEKDKGPKRRVWTWVFYGLGAGTGIGAIVTGSLQLSKKSQIEELCPNSLCPDDAATAEVSTLQSQSKRLSTTTYVLLGATAGFAILGTIFLFVEGDDSDDDVAFIPHISNEGLGATLQWKF